MNDRDVCKVDVCDRDVTARGWCGAHYNWARAHDFEREPTHEIGWPQKECSVDKCDRDARARGYCNTHYEWARKRDFEQEPTHEIGTLINGADKATETPSRDDILWAAGIFEGEGHAVYRAYTTQVTIGQQDSWLTDRLITLFGGSVWVRDDGLNLWFISGARARGFLMTIYQFLSPRRREQVKGALDHA